MVIYTIFRTGSERCREHALSGNYSGFTECHVKMIGFLFTISVMKVSFLPIPAPIPIIFKAIPTLHFAFLKTFVGFAFLNGNVNLSNSLSAYFFFDNVIKTFYAFIILNCKRMASLFFYTGSTPIVCVH